MQITANKVATFEFTVTDQSGEVLDSSEESGPYPYLHGVGHLIPGLESEMEGKSPGDSFSVTIPPTLGYGEHDESMVQQIPIDRFSGIDDLHEGMRVEATYENGVMAMTVVGIDDESVTLDGNHPLAGLTLNFDVTVVDVRDATPEEIRHQQPHLAGGCQSDCYCGCDDDGNDGCGHGHCCQ